MARLKSEIEVTCPCCQSTLVIDLNLGRVVGHKEPERGDKPELDEMAICNYRATLIDGTEFDSSAKRNGPATFAIRGMVKGLAEALQLMPVGSKWQIFVPSQLAYGENGAGPAIPPNSALIFEVELLGVKENTGPERDRE